MEGNLHRTQLEVRKDGVMHSAASFFDSTNMTAAELGHQEREKAHSDHLSILTAYLMPTYRSWRNWLLLRMLNVRMVIQDWQGFQMFEVHTFDKDHCRQQVPTDLYQTGDTVDEQIECKYQFRGASYVLNFKQGDRFVFPPYDVDKVPRVPLCQVLIATQGKENVTDVVKQHAGPMGDFHYSIVKRLPTGHEMTQCLGPIHIIDTKFRRAIIH